MSAEQAAARSDPQLDPHRVAAPLPLRRLDAECAALANAIGFGRHAAFEAEGARLKIEVTDEPGTRPGEPGSATGEAEAGLLLCLETAAGPVHLHATSALLRVLTGIDLPAGPPDDDDESIRALATLAAAQRLRAGWRNLFAMRSVQLGGAAPAGAALALRIRAEGQQWSIAGRLSAEPAVLSALISRPAWLPLARDARAGGQIALDALTIRAPVAIGLSRLQLRELNALAPGDAILIDQPLFDDAGIGAVRFGPLLMHGELGQGEAGLLFKFERWSKSMQKADELPNVDKATAPPPRPQPANAPAGGAAGAEKGDSETPGAGRGPKPQRAKAEAAKAEGSKAEAPKAEAPKAEAPKAEASKAEGTLLDELPLSVVFEVGAIDLSVAALRKMAPGHVIDLERPLPPVVTVRCRGVEIARGELVELSGRLAVQIKNLEIRDEP